MGSAIEIGVLQALAHQSQGDSAAALGALGRALGLAEPEGYVRVFASEGPPLARLLSAAAAQGMAPGYIAKLLAAFQGAAPAHAPAASQLAEPLSAREQEILQLIANGLSNGEIGARLFLALSTVKGHNRNIFDKLQVQSRTEAVARARELGLL